MTTLPYNTEELLARSKAMLAQTAAEGAKPFAGSSYEQALTQTPSAGGGAPITSSQGSTPPTGSSLVDFKNTLNQAVELAKMHRNKLSLDFMSGVVPQGTLAASDFNSILSNMNKASDKTAEIAIENVAPKKDLQTVTETDDNGNVVAVTFDRNNPSNITKVPLGPIGKTKTSSSDKQTATEKLQEVIGNYSAGFQKGVTIAGGVPTIDSTTGKATWEAWKEAISEAPSHGLDRINFIKTFGHLVLNPDGSIDDNFGLTPTEKKLITGTLEGRSL
jgi:hypothetical protein